MSNVKNVDKYGCIYSHFIHFMGKMQEEECPIVEKCAISTNDFSKMWIKIYNISHNREKFAKKPI